MAKLPTRSPTHQDIEPGRLAAMGLELEDIADGDRVALSALIELAEDRGRPPSHYLAACALASELRISEETDDRRGRAKPDLTVGPPAPLVVRVCAGTCQRYGALELLDHLVARWQRAPGFAIVPVSCLDRCDHAAACEVNGPHGQLVIAPATTAALDDALRELS